MNLELLYKQAVGLHQSGNLVEAERLYMQILAAGPFDFNACYLLGVIRAQQERNAEALELIGAALKINPTAVQALNIHGLVLHAVRRFDEALANYDKALAIRPAYAEALNNRGITLHALNRSEAALASFDEALAINPDYAEACNNRGGTLQTMKRFEEALASFDNALAIRPDYADALYNRGIVLKNLKRPEEALASYDKLLALKPDHAEAWNDRGGALQSMKRFEEALASFDKALALKPTYVGALYNRGIALGDLERLEEALANYDKVVVLKPDHAQAWNNRGVTLQSMKRFEEALTDYDKALAIKPDYAEARINLGNALVNHGNALFEYNRIEEGCATFTRHAEVVHGTPTDIPRSNEPILPHKARHDREQRDYLAGGKARDDAAAIDAMFRLENGSRLLMPAVNPDNDIADISERWQKSKPQIVVIDNLLTDEALDKLKRFCWGSTVWRRVYEDGYLGALPEYGFACPLVAQIADELRITYLTIFGAHPLFYLWGFKYDSQLAGTKIHADRAAINVNFWITPDQANLDPESGGLVIWDTAAPLDWDFSKYNGDETASRDFLARVGAQSMTVPYRANRAVIFDSDLFHETDRIVFKDGYLNRRINVTLLYGQRSPDNR
jgi:tetratricopeptide (TPR) repeat protein